MPLLLTIFNTLSEVKESNVYYQASIMSSTFACIKLYTYNIWQTSFLHFSPPTLVYPSDSASLLLGFLYMSTKTNACYNIFVSI